MTRSRKERIAASAVLVAALALLLAGMGLSHKVYEKGTQDFGMLTYTKLGDPGLVIDSTFSGVELKKGRLYSTYDRSEARGKRACPT